MCGIVGYIGKRNVVHTLVDGLKRLEYRGYDSAGIALLGDKEITILKACGKVKNLQKKISEKLPKKAEKNFNIGIAHTRWATHGAPTEANAHPHIDDSKRFAVVHNGIIENYSVLKEKLTKNGHNFTSETDTEVLAHLIAECYDGDLVQAVAAALKQVEGTYGTAVISLEQPDRMIVARRGSPIVIGVGDKETLVASDISALVAYTTNVIYLDDDDIAVVSDKDIDLRNIDNVPVSRETAKIDWDVSLVEKGGYDHFMLKEIFEQPDAISNAIRGRIDPSQGTGTLAGLRFDPRDMAEISRIIIAACGTSMHAGMVGEYFFEDLANMPTEVEQAAEFRYRNPIIEPKTLLIAISQSGETADTLAAIREAKQKGALVSAICNVVGSTIAREAARGVYLHAGPEIGVASTKAFTCQVAVLLIMALKLGRSGRLSRDYGISLVQEIERIPEQVRAVLAQSEEIKKVAVKYAKADNFFFIGRGYLYPVALEGALKLKEISYVHAEGYHAAELKHGPIALLEERIPVIALANDIPGKDKIIGNMQECKARKSPVIAIGTEGDESIRPHSDDIIWVPESSKFTAPIPTVIALQLFSYYIAETRGCEIDQPRNLAKSVTVE